MPKQIIPKRGEVYLVNFDPTIGSEIKKTRPALIIQNDIANRYSPVTIVAAITSQIGERIYPTEVLVDAKQSDLDKRCVVLLNQIRAIDKQRLVKKLAVLDSVLMEKVNQSLEISLGLAGL
ncbi:MAG: type II toxin-antitoxin system PemK/MazF family toxin [Candidatus Paceibacterota bacterium]|jgi:mRNA interferase MazF